MVDNRIVGAVAKVLLLISCAMALSPSAKGGDDELGGLALIEENDCLYTPWRAHQDRHYTQGAKFVYSGMPDDDGWLVRQMSKLPALGIDKPVASYAVSFGQNIYTPGDFIATNLIRNDRPYAGWLYAGYALQRRGEVSPNVQVMESLDLDAGVIGPEAQGGRAQNELHQLRGFHTFDGWNNQLRTEPDFVFKYARAYRLSFCPESRRYCDLIPMAGANLGTLMVSGSLSATARLGFNLPDDFGVQTIDSPMVIASGLSTNWFGCHIFGRVEGRAVGRNVFLDGNLAVTSFHIDKEPLVADFVYGGALNFFKHVEIGYTMTIRTDEFVGQKGNDRFASVFLMGTWRY